MLDSAFIFILRKSPGWLVSWAFKKIYGGKNINTFEKILNVPDKWKKVSRSPEKWIFINDNSFIIEISDNSDSFSERWTDYFFKPSLKSEVYIKINGELVHEPLIFIHVDEYRYFVPMPKFEDAYNERHYYWDKDSIEYRVFQVIGDVKSGYRSLKAFGDACGVFIKD